MNCMLARAPMMRVPSDWKSQAMETHPWPFHLKKSIILYLFIYYCSRGEYRLPPTGEASYEMGGRENWALLVAASGQCWVILSGRRITWRTETVLMSWWHVRKNGMNPWLVACNCLRTTLKLRVEEIIIIVPTTGGGMMLSNTIVVVLLLPTLGLALRLEKTSSRNTSEASIGRESSSQWSPTSSEVKAFSSSSTTLSLASSSADHCGAGQSFYHHNHYNHYNHYNHL